MCMDVCSPCVRVNCSFLYANLLFDVAARLRVMLVLLSETMRVRSATADARYRIQCYAVLLVVMRV